MSIAFLCLSTLGLLSSFPSIAQAQPAEEYVYYGYVPWNMYENATQMTWPGLSAWKYVLVANRALLIAVGNQDGTKVEVFTLPDGRLTDTLRVDRGQRAIAYLPTGAFFKAVSNKPVSLMFTGGVGLERGVEYVSTFYTSADGGYVGKEFNFISVTSTAEFWATGPPFQVYALEDSDIKVTDENGTVVAEFSLKANQVKGLFLESFVVHRLESTGHVMVQSFMIKKSCFYPAVQGGFVGRLFYGTAADSELWTGVDDHPMEGRHHPWASWAGDPRYFVLTSAEDANAVIYDVENKKKYQEFTLGAGLNRSVQAKVPYMVVQTDKPILLEFKSAELEGGLAVVGLKAGQTAYIYVPPGETYAFAYKQTTLGIDELRVSLPPDRIFKIPPGIHKVTTSENIIIEVLNVDSNQGLSYFGVSLPSAQSLDITYEGLRLKPVVPEETPVLMYAGAVAAVLIIVVAVALARRRRH